MLWLIRHGESEANAGGVTSAFDTIALTPRGLRQAERVALLFPDAPQRIVTSSYLRARQTAELTLRRFPAVSVTQDSVHEFTYLAVSRCQNTTFMDRLPMVQEYWQRLDPGYADGE